jgi:hypothetical protein
MSWAKVDDSLWRHPKIDALEGNLAALGLWTLTLSWVADTLTDGFIPQQRVTKLTGADVNLLAADLVAAGLWEVAPGGWRIHDYLDYNPDADTVRARREAGRVRLAEWRRNGVTNGVSNSVRTHTPVPVPVPDPGSPRNGVTHAVSEDGGSPGLVPLPARSAT